MNVKWVVNRNTEDHNKLSMTVNTKKKRMDQFDVNRLDKRYAYAGDTIQIQNIKPLLSNIQIYNKRSRLILNLVSYY